MPPPFSDRFAPYFKSPFSPGFTKWVKGNFQGDSSGNGAMMRISPVGYLFNTEEDVIKLVEYYINNDFKLEEIKEDQNNYFGYLKSSENYDVYVIPASNKTGTSAQTRRSNL